MQVVRVTDDRDAALAEVGAEIPSASAEDLDRTPFLLIGSPEQLAAQLRRQAGELGITSYVVREPAVPDLERVPGPAERLRILADRACRRRIKYLNGDTVTGISGSPRPTTLSPGPRTGRERPGHRAARAAARQAVQAADALARDRGTAARPAAAGPGPVAAGPRLVAGDPAARAGPGPALAPPTERALASVPPDSPEWGETVGEAVQRLGVIMPAAEHQRPPRRRPGADGACQAAVHRSSSGGPRVRQAQARLLVFYLTAAADAYAAARVDGRWEQVADQAYLDMRSPTPRRRASSPVTARSRSSRWPPRCGR